MKITAQSASGRAYPEVHLNVRGRTSGWDGYRGDWVYTNIETGGLLHQPYGMRTQGVTPTKRKRGNEQIEVLMRLPAKQLSRQRSMSSICALAELWGG